MGDPGGGEVQGEAQNRLEKSRGRTGWVTFRGKSRLEKSRGKHRGKSRGRTSWVTFRGRSRLEKSRGTG